MLWGAVHGALELRQEAGGVRIVGRFPYGLETELAPGRRERIEAAAFAERIRNDEGDIHFLSGHDYGKPLASRQAGSLQIRDMDDHVSIEARIDAGTSWASDFLAAHKAGLIRGLSPGFRVPPGGERIERSGNAVLRSITRAELFEISAVTRPAYPAAQIEARAWAANSPPAGAICHPLRRWRA